MITPRTSHMQVIWISIQSWFLWVKPKNRPGPAGARKNCPRYHCSWLL